MKDQPANNADFLRILDNSSQHGASDAAERMRTFHRKTLDLAIGIVNAADHKDIDAWPTVIAASRLGGLTVREIEDATLGKPAEQEDWLAGKAVPPEAMRCVHVANLSRKLSHKIEDLSIAADGLRVQIPRAMRSQFAPSRGPLG